MPQSGILNYESTLPYPNLDLQSVEGYSIEVISSYTAQLYLRKQLNGIHDQLYSRTPRDMHKTMEEKIVEIQHSLKGNKVWVPAEYHFSDEDPPANDILSARLRAKYWGSQVILHRPFIDNILHDELKENTFSGGPPHPSQWQQEGIDVGVGEVPSHIDPRALSYARLGIKALMESTRAFYGLEAGQRILVTNVFTTAHA
jgi:hypothetical protein